MSQMQCGIEQEHNADHHYDQAFYQQLDALIDFAHHHLDVSQYDHDWVCNRLIEALSLDSYAPTGTLHQGLSIDELLEQLYISAHRAGVWNDDEDAHYTDIIMGILSAAPSYLNKHFADVEERDGGDAAMQWLYNYCVDNTYVKKSVLDRNPRFLSHGLVITINLAKPEFKNMKKAAAGNSVSSSGYPACTICHTNEGFAARYKRTLRTVHMELDHHPWFWRFSPYGYFDQHGICVNNDHTPMHVDAHTFVALLDFVDRFPHYFLGCNAALPRIGGSILAHDHYQGGVERLPMHTASAYCTYKSEQYPQAVVEVLDWPGTAVRVVSRSRQDITALSESIRQAWATYSNEDLQIRCVGDEGQQSSLSPSVIITERGYEMSLIFRNNAVSKEFPDGIFHAHPDFYPIKQEPVGLIEAQGLFILPGRLVEQLRHIEDALVAGEGLPAELSEFHLIFRELQEALQGNRDRNAVQAAIHDCLGSVCERILGNTAVFKDKKYTQLFLENLGLQLQS